MSLAVAVDAADVALARVGSDHHHDHRHLVELPQLWKLAKHAVPTLVECTLLPFLLFTAALQAWGLGVALAVGLTYTWGRVAVRAVRHRGVPALLLLAGLSLTARTLTVLITGSTTLYFLAPSAATLPVSIGFLASVRAGRPAAARLAADLLPLPADLLARPAVHAALSRITVLWAVVNVLNAAVATTLLFTQSVGTYYVVKFVFAHVVMAGALVASVALFRSALRRPAVLAVP